MIELTQFSNYYEISFFGEAGETDKKEVIDKIPDVSPNDVRLYTNVYDNESNWCLYIKFGFDSEE